MANKRSVTYGVIRVLLSMLATVYALALQFSFTFGRSEFKAYSHIINSRRHLLKEEPESEEAERLRNEAEKRA